MMLIVMMCRSVINYKVLKLLLVLSCPVPLLFALYCRVMLLVTDVSSILVRLNRPQQTATDRKISGRANAHRSHLGRTKLKMKQTFDAAMLAIQAAT